MRRRYALGIDFGSLSGRALLVDIANGSVAATAVAMYPHGCMEESLPVTGERLPPDWSLHHPGDYLDVLQTIIPEVLQQSGIEPADLVGVGIAATACTVLPVQEDGTPLCFLPAFRENKHAYIRLWKDHAAREQAVRLNEVARRRGEDFLGRYGGKISSEWLFPKLWHLLEEAPEVYAAMDRLVEVSDWIVFMLTGEMSRNSCAAGFKALWHKQTGYPSPDFFKSLDPRLEQVVKQKFLDEVDQTGSRAGLVTPAAAELTGLQAGTAVAVGHVDAHVAMPAVGITTPGQMLMIMGTSTCHLLLAEQEQSVPGICGVVEDGIIPGLYGYEAGQNCVGDLFHWFVQHHVPEQYHAQAKKEGVSIHQVLRRQACKQKPGETGLLALDWWNGNRSVLVDSDLSGLIIGLNLSTRAADIYRALIESTAYGTRLIMDSLIKSGLPVESLLACGGIAGKDPMMMQIYADVTRRPIRISDQKQTVALGAAMYGAVAAGTKQGGYDTIIEAARTMPKLKPQVYQPEPEHARIYDQLYHEYCRLHDYFGRGINDVQKVLKAIRLQA